MKTYEQVILKILAGEGYVEDHVAEEARTRADIEKEIEHHRQKIMDISNSNPGNHPQAIDARRRMARPHVKKKEALQKELENLKEDVSFLYEDVAEFHKEMMAHHKKHESDYKTIRHYNDQNAIRGGTKHGYADTTGDVIENERAHAEAREAHKAAHEAHVNNDKNKHELSKKANELTQALHKKHEHENVALVKTPKLKTDDSVNPHKVGSVEYRKHEQQRRENNKKHLDDHLDAMKELGKSSPTKQMARNIHHGLKLSHARQHTPTKENVMESINQHYKSYEQAALDILCGNKSEEEKPVQQEQQSQQEPQNLLEEVHPDALHVKPVKMNGQTKYKVHAVGSNFSSGIKPGEHLSDSELDDFSEMGGKIKHMKEEVEELDEKVIIPTSSEISNHISNISNKLRNKPKEGSIQFHSHDPSTGSTTYKQTVHNNPAIKMPTHQYHTVSSSGGVSTSPTPPKSNDRLQGRSPMKSMTREEVEELDEMGPGKLPRIDKKVENEYSDKLMADFKAKGGQVQQVKSPALPKNRNRMVARGSLSSGERTVTRSGGKSYTARMEEVEEDYDQLIEEKNAFEIELPEQLIFADYLKAASQFTESYDDAIVVADSFFRNNDESLVIEAFTRSDIEDRVKMHQKAGNQVTMPKYGMKDNKPYAEYSVTDKESGKKTKYIHHGNMRRVERMN